MNLEPALEPELLYWAAGSEVNEHRPLFTGDVLTDIEIPGLGRSSAMIVGHPCSFRGQGGRLAQQIPVALVESHPPVPSRKWAKGFFNRMPLAGLPLEAQFYVARLDCVGLARTEDLTTERRIACLSHTGINQLQQRLVFHLTRVVVPMPTFQMAFANTYEEAELLEEWVTELVDLDLDQPASFERWIREGDPSRQDLLEDPQNRAGIRRQIRQEIARRRAGTP